jgi:branched-chain amino acid transport system permease protein
VLAFLVAGLVFGGVYAIAALGLSATYKATGILNFGFAALAYFFARMYYFLNSQHGWSIALAGIVTIVVAAPVIGVVLWAVLFRTLTHASTLIQVVSTVGLSVAVPAITNLVFGSITVAIAPGLAPQSAGVFHFLGVPINADHVIVFICVVVIAGLGIVLLRFTNIGLTVRALVDSQSMTALAGVNTQAVAAGVWAFSMFLSALAGVLMGPLIGLDSSSYALLIAAALAAVLAAKLSNVGWAFGAALLLGILTGLAQWALPPSSTYAQEIIPAIPFIFIVVFALIYSRGQRATEDRTALARLAQVEVSAYPNRMELPPAHHDEAPRVRVKSLAARNSSWIIPMVIVALLPLILQGYWVGLIAEGIVYAIAFLSYTLITGEAGVISLCQITFAGIGSITAAQLATHDGWPVLLAVVAGGVITLPIGALLGMLALRLGDLYVALVTLTFGILVENLIWPINAFYQYGSGVTVGRPGFATGTRAFTYMVLLIFCMISILIVNFRRTTPGLALRAVRWSEPGARTIGLSVVQMKVLASSLSAMVAGIAGGLLAMYTGLSLTTNYATLLGLVWLAVLVTNGIRSNVAALAAGITFAIIPAVFLNYLPVSLGNVPTALFGLGAINLARQPNGVLVQNRQMISAGIRRLRGRHGVAPETVSAASSQAT